MYGNLRFIHGVTARTNILTKQMPLPKIATKIFISMTKDSFMYEMHAVHSHTQQQPI